MPKKRENRDTVGKLARDLLVKRDTPTHTPIEQMREQLSEYEKNVEICLETHKKLFPGDFYVVVLTKKEKLMEKVIRNYFYGRLSCPTPNYDKCVYSYSREENKLELLWVIPDRKTAKYFRDYRHEVNPTQFELLSYVLKFADGSLFRLAKELNGEKEDSPELKEERWNKKISQCHLSKKKLSNQLNSQQEPKKNNNQNKKKQPKKK